MGKVNEPHLAPHPVARNVRVLCAAHNYLSRRGKPVGDNPIPQHGHRSR
jgi:hypothetical protein